tara:strand:+ start:32631 stop:33200 length:570 start_codon:yes stop_codon:yes gene_type:complete
MQKNYKTSSYHDFGDGNGPVLAHQHFNGLGWVADTAQVDDTAFVGLKARVFGLAVVLDEAVVKGSAEVSGYAIVKDCACVKGHSVVRGSSVIKDHAEISGYAFVASHIEIGGHEKLDEETLSFSVENCLGCPLLLEDNYSAGHNNPCLYCLEKSKTQLKGKQSSRSSIGSWLPQDGAVNQDEEEKAGRP